MRWHLEPGQIKGLDLSREMEVSQFPGGHSNLTYLVRFGGAELVLRRPPLGPVPPKAHDMAREYRWLAAMHPVFPLAPRPYVLCEDPRVIGSVFYVMERRRGIVVRHDEPMSLANHPETRRRVSEALIDTLAELHAIDVDAPPIAALGKPAGFVGAPGRRMDGTVGRLEDRRCAGNGRAGGWLVDADATGSGAAGGRPRRLQAGQRAARSARSRPTSSRCSTGR